MRFLIITMLFLFATPGFAKKIRKPSSNKLPKKAYTFVCKSEGQEEDAVIGITSIAIHPNDTTTGQASTSIFIRQGKDFSYKTFNGPYVSAPSGFILLNTKKESPTKINVHPADTTDFPGLPKQVCTITAQMEN